MEQAINMAELLGDLDFDPVALKAKYLQERDKRIREDGNEQYVEVTAEFSHYIDDPYVDPGFTREPLHDEVEVAIIGGGFGGLLMAARLREAGFEDIRMIERAGDFGGTWYWNRYPGLCAMWNPTVTYHYSKNSITCRSTSTPSHQRSSNTANALHVTTTFTKTLVYKRPSPN